MASAKCLSSATSATLLPGIMLHPLDRSGVRTSGPSGRTRDWSHLSAVADCVGRTSGPSVGTDRRSVLQAVQGSQDPRWRVTLSGPRVLTPLADSSSRALSVEAQIGHAPQAKDTIHAAGQGDAAIGRDS